jgi:ABC-type dipeptide/oligopeptide/nickel transport system permease subunit
MSTPSAVMDSASLERAIPKGRSLWRDAWQRLKKDRFAVFCLGVIAVYFLVALLAKLGLIASAWNVPVGGNYDTPSAESVPQLLGTDILGRSVFYKVIHGARVAISVGLIATLIAVPIGVALGALAGYFGGWVDDLIQWFYTTLSSIPYILLLVAIAFVMGKGIASVYIAIGATSWIGLARVIRGEFIKHKNREYVVAASALGASHGSRIFKHILPNVSHQVIIFFTLSFQGAIRSEVILSYLGLGVQGQPSWGVMIDDARLELARGVWWQLSGATVGMFFLVLAFSVFGDALRDALDPKLK